MASSQPPPKASPLTAAIVTTRERSISRSSACISLTSCRPAASSIVVNALMSAPAQNSIGLAEANTSARMAPSSVTASQSFRRACTTSGEIELAGGRSQPGDRDRSRVSSLTGLSSQPASGRG